MIVDIDAVDFNEEVVLTSKATQKATKVYLLAVLENSTKKLKLFSESDKLQIEDSSEITKL